MTDQDKPADDSEDWGASGTPWQEKPQSPPRQEPPQQQPGQPYAHQGQSYPQQSYPQGGWQGIPGQPPKIQNYLVPAILATLLCFLPTGIAAIVFAAQVNGKLNAGDYAGAKKASDNAKTWTIVSVVVGLILAVLILASA